MTCSLQEERLVERPLPRNVRSESMVVQILRIVQRGMVGGVDSCTPLVPTHRAA